MSTPLSRSAQVSPLITDDESDYKDEHEKDDHCTLSFNDPITGSTRPAYIFPLFVIINISTMVDRSIILGASLEFSAFLSSAQDSPQAVKDNPDLGIGLLQAALGIGYLVSLLFSGHYVHKIRWKPLVLFIFCVWLLGVFGSGYSKQYNSFYVLLFSRMATGCREAAFQVVVPPLIQDRGGMYTGLWLSVYLAGLPVGLASGYVYGSFIACSDRWGWDWAYYFLFIVSLPQLLVLMFVKDESNGGILVGVEQHNAVDYDGNGLTVHEPLLGAPAEDDNERVNLKFTVFSELKACISCPVLVTLSLGWAAILGACVSISTFGVSFVVALELFDNENVAASWFGTLAAVAGILGTILGGRLADKVLKQYRGREGDARRGDGVDDAFRHPIIASMLPRISMLVVMSMIFVFPTVVVHNAVVFLVLLFIGWVLLFMTTTGINLTAMLAVDRCYRPNASAFLMLTSNIVGALPLPIVMGLIKDKLAPSCRVGPSGEFDDPEQCHAEGAEIRKCLAMAYSWVLWSLAFFEIARQFSWRNAERSGRQEVRRSIRCYWRDQKELQ